MKRSDLDLARAVLAKDRKATAEFVDRFAGPVCRYLRSRVNPAGGHADDLAQEVFLTAWEHLDQYRGSAPLEGWLIGIARHKVEDYYRDRLREPLELEEAGAGPIDESRLDAGEEIDRARRDVRVAAVLAEMDPDYAAVILWRYWEKVSARDIAARTGRTEKAVERLLARAREQFRKRWQYA